MVGSWAPVTKNGEVVQEPVGAPPERSKVKPGPSQGESIPAGWYVGVGA